MSMQDPIADMLTCIRNAHHRSKPEVNMPSSKLKAAIAKVLQEEGYINGFSVSEDVKPTLTLDLKYFDGKPVIEEIKRTSKPSLRQYSGSSETDNSIALFGLNSSGKLDLSISSIKFHQTKTASVSNCVSEMSDNAVSFSIPIH